MTWEIQPFSQDPVLELKTLCFACFPRLHFRTGLLDHEGRPTGYMHAAVEGLGGWNLPVLFLPTLPAALEMPGSTGKGGHGEHRAAKSSQCKR